MKKIIIIFFVLLISNLSISQEKYTLKKVIGIAIKNNQDLITLQNSINVQNLQIKSAKGDLLPSLNFSTGWNWNNTYSAGGTIYQNGIPIILPAQSSSKSSYSLSLNSSVLLFNGFANYSTIEMNKQTLNGLNIQYDKIKYDLSIVVTKYFFDVLKKTFIVKTYEENLNVSVEQLNKIKEYVAVGKKTQAEVYKQDVEVAQNELNLENAINDLRKAKVDLLTSMNSNIEEDMEVDLTDINTDLSNEELLLIKNKYTDAEDLVNKSFSSRYDYKNYMQDIKISEIKLDIANKNLLYPTINAFGNYNVSGNAIKEIVDNRVLTVGINLSYSIFQGFKLDVNKQIAEVNLKQKHDDLDRLKTQIKSEIKKSIIDLQTAYKQIEILDRNIVSAEQDKLLSEENYRIGYGTLLDVQTATAKLNSLRIQKINALYNFLLAEKQIQYLTGNFNY
jgi:outer membrane protein